MVFTQTTASGEGLTLITDVGHVGVTRHRVEEYCARRSRQPLVDYYRTVQAHRRSA